MFVTQRAEKLEIPAVGFEQNRRKSVQISLRDRMITCLAYILFALGTAHVVYMKSQNVYYFWYDPLVHLYSILVAFYILSRFVLAYFYKVPQDVGYLPTISVVIACKNEEQSIAKTLEAIYASDYPRDRMEVIAVDDGSTDKTYEEMKRIQERERGLNLIQFPRNLGKRHGMAAGAKAATGDILVYIDSDSFVQRNTLRKLVQPFLDSTIGAVCGHANVHNVQTNILTKMQEVRYYVAFHVVKAAESLFSAVTCCSGCLAAYRRDAVMSILDVWLGQTFLGTTATFGDDRSLTNFMLRKYRVIYHAGAICSTLVPETFTQLLRQQLRWKKSWIRESLIASTFMWKRHPWVAFFFYLGVLFPLISPIIVFNTMVLPLLGFKTISLLYVYGIMLMAVMYSLYYLAKIRTRIFVYGVYFGLFYMFVFVWQTYYALFTMRRNHWGTR